MEKESKFGKKTLLAWVREIFTQHESELSDIPAQPPEETVGRLISKAAGEQQQSANEQQQSANDQQQSTSCAYAVRRNIVASLHEIRVFAEKHNLTAALVKALLVLLAEMAIGAMKGKVGEKALDVLLKAFQYQQHIEEAYLRGKNESIVMEYFPESDEIPHLGSMSREEPDSDNIFTMARQA